MNPELDMDTLPRCPWVDLRKPLYIAYHDTEWGVPVRDDQTMFEFLVLEAAQAGLSWYTVLSKRDNYRRAFDGFDAGKMACYDDARIAALMADAGIIRNRLKIEAAINNARCYLELRAQRGSFSDYLWEFVGNTSRVNSPRTAAEYLATSAESDALSKDLKRRGFRFVGSTIMYAHMQATGMVNDHACDCFRRRQISPDVV
jgi:DNA-3-methyladenine glycosylase I